MVKTPPLNVRGTVSIPGWKTKIPHAMGPKIKKKEREKKRKVPTEIGTLLYKQRYMYKDVSSSSVCSGKKKEIESIPISR